MLLLVPIRSDVPLRRAPRVNHALIAINIVIYLLTDVLSGIFGAGGGGKFEYMLWPDDLRLHQLFTYQFLHGDILHLFFNMLFLWTFGNNVNAKMGHVPYLLLYLACGAFAGAGFAVTGASGTPLLGASGAVAGITTAYLVLYPRTELTVFYWVFILIGTLRIRALPFIGLKIVLWDNLLAPSLSGGGGAVQVAYSAHIAGYFFGFVTCCLLLLIRMLPRDQFDILALAKRYYQRKQFKSAMADPDTKARATHGRVARPVSVSTTGEAQAPPVAEKDEVSRLRTEISGAIAQHDYTSAAHKYETLVAKDPSQCLPRSNMLLVANQLMTLNRYPQAAAAYERFLKTYPTCSDVRQVKLLLGIIYAKYLQQYEAAQPYLRESASKLTDPEQVRQATHWLETSLAALRQRPSTA